MQRAFGEKLATVPSWSAGTARTEWMAAPTRRFADGFRSATRAAQASASPSPKRR